MAVKITLKKKQQQLDRLRGSSLWPYVEAAIRASLQSGRYFWLASYLNGLMKPSPTFRKELKLILKVASSKNPSNVSQFLTTA